MDRGRVCIFHTFLQVCLDWLLSRPSSRSLSPSCSVPQLPLALSEPDRGPPYILSSDSSRKVNSVDS